MDNGKSAKLQHPYATFLRKEKKFIKIEKM